MAKLSDLGLIGPPVDPTQVELEHAVDGKPFGLLHKEWSRLKGSMRLGDELRYYSSPWEDWDAFAGEEGYVLVRNGNLVARIVITRN